MSKLPQHKLYESIHTVIQSALSRGLENPEAIELKIVVKMHDPLKCRRLNGAKSNKQVCILADQQHCEEAYGLNIPWRDEQDMLNLNENKKRAKKIAKKYLAFLVSDTIAQEIPPLLGTCLKNAGKSPRCLSHHDSMTEKIEEVKADVKRELRKIISISVEVGHVGMPQAEIAENVDSSINFFLGLLKKHWHNVKSLDLKPSMGQPCKMYVAE